MEGCCCETSAASARLNEVQGGVVLHHPANAVRQRRQAAKDSGCVTPVLANGSSGQGARLGGA